MTSSLPKTSAARQNPKLNPGEPKVPKLQSALAAAPTVAISPKLAISAVKSPLVALGGVRLESAEIRGFRAF